MHIKYKTLYVSSSSIVDMVFFLANSSTQNMPLQVPPYQTLFGGSREGPTLGSCPCILKSTKMSSKYFSTSVVGTRDFKWHILHPSQNNNKKKKIF
jgi:hypothetical protein